ncbi:MAG: hypothetical protein WC673_03135 [Candidatus Paceibacterota bacterium]|jgi:hypothetical protein
MAKLTLKDFQEVATERGGKCLSDKYVNSQTKLKWRCNEEHEWEAVPNSVKLGTWCPVCADNQKLGIEKMNQIAEERGGKCLSDKYVSNKVRLKWQCEKGHIWQATPSKILQGRWCHKCGGSQRLNIDDMHSIANKKGGKCLSEKYVNVITKLKWQCSERHIWETAPLHVLEGTWCPICSIGISERICREFFERIFLQKFPKKKPLWLRNKRGNLMELDGYCEKLKLAFEYHGEYHYSKKIIESAYKRSLKQRQEDDRDKLKLCIENKIILVEVPYTVKFNDMEDFILKECEKKHIFIPNYNQINISEFKIYSPTWLKNMQEIAKERGGKCLSEGYFDTHSKLKWQCKNGHMWEATPAHVKSGTWCPVCGGSQKLDITEPQELAIMGGGKCLSDEYINAHTKLKWQCKNGHIWEAEPNSIKQGTWCPECSYKTTAKKAWVTKRKKDH